MVSCNGFDSQPADENQKCKPVLCEVESIFMGL